MYDDLDLSTPEGQKEALARIDQTVAAFFKNDDANAKAYRQRLVTQLEQETQRQATKATITGGKDGKGNPDPDGIAATLRGYAGKLASGGMDYQPDYKWHDNAYSGMVSGALKSFGQQYGGMEGMPRMQAALNATVPALTWRAQAHNDERREAQRSKVDNTKNAANILGGANDVYMGHRQLALDTYKTDVARELGLVNAQTQQNANNNSGSNAMGDIIKVGLSLL